MYCTLIAGALAVGLAHFGQGEGPIVLDGVQCSGLETYITDCHHNGFFTHNCIHAEDAGVQCLRMLICNAHLHVHACILTYSCKIFTMYANQYINIKHTLTEFVSYIHMYMQSIIQYCV